MSDPVTPTALELINAGVDSFHSLDAYYGLSDQEHGKKPSP